MGDGAREREPLAQPLFVADTSDATLYNSSMAIKLALDNSDELTVRLEEMRQLHADLDAALAAVARHHQDLAGIKRRVAVLTAEIESPMKKPPR